MYQFAFRENVDLQFQALVLAFNKPAIKLEYEFIQHMVYGVAFFGTPFQGSRNADFMSPVMSLIGTFSKMNTNFLDDLKTSSRDLPKLTMLFNNIKTEEGIEALVFVEKKADGPSKVVCVATHRRLLWFLTFNCRRHELPQFYHSKQKSRPLKLMQTIVVW